MAGIPALQDCCYRLSTFLRAHRNAAVPEAGVGLTTEEKRALARLIFMICEPSRLRSVRIFTSEVMAGWSDEVVTRELRTRVNGWSKMSRFTLHCLALGIRNREDEYAADDIGKKELKAVEFFGMKTPEDAVGPNGELLLVRCRDYKKDDENARHRRKA